MTCLSATDIARVVSGELDSTHVGECLTCRRAIERDGSLRDTLRVSRSTVLTPGRRRTIAAELFARIEQEPEVRRRSWPFAVAAAAAAAAVFLVYARSVEPTAPSTPIGATPSTTDVRVAGVSHEDTAPELPAPRIDAEAGVRMSRISGVDRDVVTLADGSVEIDTRASRDVDVRVGTTVVRIDDATVAIQAREHAIVRVRVVVGAARIDAPDQHVILERDAVWTPPQPSLVAFRDAWIALRAGQYRDALAKFDRVTDPVVREEAMYWSVIAAYRAGDRDLARERTTAFLRAFPNSDYAASLERQ